MEDKVKLSSSIILKKRFTADVKGYNPDEVDSFLDLVIADYGSFAAYQKETMAYIEKLENAVREKEAKCSSLSKQLQSYYEKNKQMEIDNASYKKRFEGIKPSDKPTSENLDLIKRINQLETFFYSHGFSPSDLEKKSDYK